MTHADAMSDMFHRHQNEIVQTLGEYELDRSFQTSDWELTGTGGGRTCVLEDGQVFERAATNVSLVRGDQAPAAITDGHVRPDRAGLPFHATGLSMILHPRNPYAPSFHANFRYFEVGDEWWFGGGMDLTPMYGFEEDAVHFHKTIKEWCDRHDNTPYDEWKAACDSYFYLPHRGETRGVGGVFFDFLAEDGPGGRERCMASVEEGLSTILRAYLPVLDRRYEMPYGERERFWQTLRRGRYVEFNLVYDRGTAFGLQTGVNIDSVLMSMPPVTRWAFRPQVAPGSPEAKTAEFLSPRDWVGLAEAGGRPAVLDAAGRDG